MTSAAEHAQAGEVGETNQIPISHHQHPQQHIPSRGNQINVKRISSIHDQRDPLALHFCNRHICSHTQLNRTKYHSHNVENRENLF